MRAAPAVFAALAAVSATACTQSDSFLAVTLLRADGAPAFEHLQQFRVEVDNGGATDTLMYPKQPTADVTVDRVAADPPGTPMFSVGFKRSRGGEARVRVFALRAGETVAFGTGMATIVKDDTAAAFIELAPGTGPADGGQDGGQDGKPDGGQDAKPDGGGDALVTCDPAAPASCGAGMTCAISCSAAAGLCTPGGNGASGASCSGNADCKPGTSCFVYDACSVKACVSFCKTDGDCGGGRCIEDITCGGATSLGRICSFPCDPRGAALKGCPSGLTCFLYDNELPDCACKDASRTGGDGAVCTDNRNCAPGLHCINIGGDLRCRPVCKLSEGNADCSGGATCTKLTNYDTWGACL